LAVLSLLNHIPPVINGLVWKRQECGYIWPTAADPSASVESYICWKMVIPWTAFGQSSCCTVWVHFTSAQPDYIAFEVLIKNFTVEADPAWKFVHIKGGDQVHWDSFTKHGEPRETMLFFLEDM
jgi:hypothetical protein